MCPHTPIREKLFKIRKRKRECSAAMCLDSFEKDQKEVRMRLDAEVTLNWDPTEKTIEYIIYGNFSRSIVREFEGATSEIIVEFLTELKGRYPELRIMNTLTLL